MAILTPPRHLDVLRQALSDADAGAAQYKTDLFGIITYAGQVHGYVLPNLNNPAQWPGGASAYQATQTAWSQTTGVLQGWAQSTLNNLTALPVTLINNGTQVVSPALGSAIGVAQLLQSNPNDQAAKNELMFTLNLLSSNLNLMSGMTAPVITSMENQATVFDQNAATMNEIAAAALQTAGNDRAQITQLNQTISNLQSDIKAQAAAIAGGSLAAVLGIGMGILAIALAPATGGVSLFLLVPAVLITAGGALIIGLSAAKIVQDKEAIQAAGDSITSYNADIVSVNAMSTTLTGFSGQVDAMKSSLNTVVAPWQAAETYFTTTLGTLSQIEGATSQDWAQVSQELQEIQSGWTSLMTTAADLNLSKSQVATNVSLSLTMTDAQITQTLAGATNVPLSQYLVAA
jgi:hypothetical protein